MENDKLIFGLAGRHYRDIVHVFRRYPHIEQVLIFGSRAKGEDKPYSDIDLAVVAPNMDDQEFSRLWNELDALELVFKLDVLHLDKLGQQRLKDSIMTHGQYFYPRSMERFLEVREAIYDHFQGSSAGPEIFFKAENRDRYAAYYTSMYLLQDVGEALCQHRLKGFSKVPLQAYLEFWGIMQALIIQQEAICEIYHAITGSKLGIRKDSDWNRLRDLRNQSAGHPAKRDHNVTLTRTFMGRDFGDYPAVTMEVWHAETDSRTHPRINLASMMDAYEKEAVGYLQEILAFMQEQWPLGDVASCTESSASTIDVCINI
jgi:predicted nucleotidyltransferase